MLTAYMHSETCNIYFVGVVIFNAILPKSKMVELVGDYAVIPSANKVASPIPTIYELIRKLSTGFIGRLEACRNICVRMVCDY